MKRMTEAEYTRFLTEGARTMKVATVRADGRPHIAPVWFALDGETIVFTTGRTSVKGINLRRDPRVSLCVDDDSPPFAFAIIEGTATMTEDADDLLYWATRIGGRYMGADKADEYGKRNGVPGELLVRVTPTKVTAQSGIAE
jgi:PPOX class probable F420-dependent enzyme